MKRFCGSGLPYDPDGVYTKLHSYVADSFSERPSVPASGRLSQLLCLTQLRISLAIWYRDRTRHLPRTHQLLSKSPYRLSLSENDRMIIKMPR